MDCCEELWRVISKLYTTVNILKFIMGLWVYGSLYCTVEALYSPLSVC